MKEEAVTAEQLLELKKAIPRDQRLKLEGFDAQRLYYYVVSETPRPNRALVIERRLKLKRGPATEAQLGLAGTLDFYERGERGVRGGMGPQEVLDTLGEPSYELTLGRLGNCVWVYADREIRFLEGLVAGTSERRPADVLPKSATYGNGPCVTLKVLHAKSPK